MIKYIGSKRALVPEILALLARFDSVRTVLDLFSGTSRVGHACKRAGYRVLANDHNAYAHTLGVCYVEADREAVEDDARRVLSELRDLPGREGFFTRTYCKNARFFRPENGARVDAIRDALAELDPPRPLAQVLLTALMEAADRVDSTCGLQMAYLKSWAKRAYAPLDLRMPDVLPAVPHGPCEAHALDALDAARTLAADVAYVDPPYNQHSYLSNYHVWETLVRWDAPEVYGVAQKRVDCRTRKSPFNSKRRCGAALADVLGALQVPLVILSMSDEGYLSPAELRDMLAARGPVATFDHDFKRYVGAQIGIHSPQGEKVGSVGRLRNREHLLIAATELASPKTRDQVAAMAREGCGQLRLPSP